MQCLRQFVKGSCFRIASFRRNDFDMSKNFFSVLRDPQKAKRKSIATAQKLTKKRLAFPTCTPTTSQGIHTKDSLEKEWKAIEEEKYRPDQEFLAKMKVFGCFEVRNNGDESDWRDCPTFEEMLTTCGVIREVKLSKRGENLKIKGDKLTFVVHAFGDCCSQSWFEAYVDMSFRDLIGKSVVSVKTKERIDYSYSGRDQYDENDLYSLVLANEDGSECVRPKQLSELNEQHGNGGIRDLNDGDGITQCKDDARNDADTFDFKFLFRNSSNGYYHGYPTVESCCATGTEEVYVKNPDARVVFVLGLPGSGKTTFVRNHFENRNEWKANAYETLDDCLFDPLFLLQTKEKLERGARLVLNDPRFCEDDKFEYAFNRVLRSLVSAKQISIVTFENNPEQCIKNNEEKKRYNRWRASSPEYITELSLKYPITLRYIGRLKECVQHQVPVAVPPDRDALLKLRRSENETKGDYWSLLGVY